MSQTPRIAWSDPDAADLWDMDLIVKVIHAAGFPAHVEQTGGGCATIYAGPTWEDPDYGTRYACIAGPGAFYGPRWTLGRMSRGDCYVGPDDDGASTDYWQPRDDATEVDIAAEMVRQCKAFRPPVLCPLVDPWARRPML